MRAPYLAAPAIVAIAALLILASPRDGASATDGGADARSDGSAFGNPTGDDVPTTGASVKTTLNACNASNGDAWECLMIAMSP